MLLPYSSFDLIFDELRSKKVYFHSCLGWAGDFLIDQAAKQMFIHYDITISSIEDCDFILESGGGNLGNNYALVNTRRDFLYEEAAKYNKKIIILPKSFYGYKQNFPEVVYKVYARESITQNLVPHSILAPDLALGYHYWKSIKQPIYDFGLFLRDDKEKTVESVNNVCDPIVFAKNSFMKLFDLASDYATICTNRLHFAIVGLILQRKVILLPNAYFKNYGMYLSWLKRLGCLWEHDLSNCDKKAVLLSVHEN